MTILKVQTIGTSFSTYLLSSYFFFPIKYLHLKSQT